MRAWKTFSRARTGITLFKGRVGQHCCEDDVENNMSGSEDLVLEDSAEDDGSTDSLDA